VDTWQDFRASIPWEIACQQFNLLGSHDTERILARTGGNEQLARLAAVILMTYPGVPCVYYGDEIGLGADRQPISRECMPWDAGVWNAGLRSWYQRLTGLRRSAEALIEGGFQVIRVEGDFLAYLRDTDQQQIIVTANRSAAPRPAEPLDVSHCGLPEGAHFREFFSGKTISLQNGMLEIGPVEQGAQVWISE
jgi:alpha-glucosidase